MIKQAFQFWLFGALKDRMTPEQRHSSTANTCMKMSGKEKKDARRY